MSYLLWPETVRYLDRYPSNHPEYVLVSAAGTPLWRDELREGKRSKTDLVHVQYSRGRGEGRATKPAIPLADLRKVSATKIESSKEYGRFVGHFLGHAPSSIAERHYAPKDPGLFDECLVWLRGEILGENLAL